MANFYQYEEEKLVRVQPFFTHKHIRPLISINSSGIGSDRSSLSFQSKKPSFSSRLQTEESSYRYSHRHESIRKRSRVELINSNYLSKSVHMDSSEDETSKRLRLLSSFVLKQFEEESYYPENRRKIMKGYFDKARREIYVNKKMEKHSDEFYNIKTKSFDSVSKMKQFFDEKNEKSKISF